MKSPPEHIPWNKNIVVHQTNQEYFKKLQQIIIYSTHTCSFQEIQGGLVDFIYVGASICM